MSASTDTLNVEHKPLKPPAGTTEGSPVEIFDVLPRLSLFIGILRTYAARCVTKKPDWCTLKQSHI